MIVSQVGNCMRTVVSGIIVHSSRSFEKWVVFENMEHEPKCPFRTSTVRAPCVVTKLSLQSYDRQPHIITDPPPNGTDYNVLRCMDCVRLPPNPSSTICHMQDKQTHHTNGSSFKDAIFQCLHVLHQAK